LVDEINRAELSRVFGELMYCLEKRGQKHSILTQYSYLKEEDDKQFYVPENIFFIGTMNDVDKSIDSFDLALRRRFLWHRMDCDYGVIINELPYVNIGNDKSNTGYLKCCYELNNYIINDFGLGKLYEIGHAYFLVVENYVNNNNNNITKKNLEHVFDDRLAPLLKEYLRSEFRENEIDQHIKNAKNKFIEFIDIKDNEHG
jgi:5-methylcytosine-specific restriction protein B